jgi:hypothetical protein
MQQNITTQLSNDTPRIQTSGQRPKQAAQGNVGRMVTDYVGSERQLAGGEVNKWRPGDDPSDETPPEQHLHFPLSLADWGPRNSLL